MDIKERLRRINANSFYGVGQIDRECIIKEVENILRRNNMTEEKFIRVVERTANAAIATGRNAETVIHDMIKVLYGRKDINKLLPDGWIIANDCSECAYKDDPGDSDACYRCYNKLFNKNIIRLDPGPYTNNFKSKDKKEKEETAVPRHWCADCKYCTLGATHYPCRNCFRTDDRSYFTPKEDK